MKFCSDEQKENEIILKVLKEDNHYTIKYMDGHSRFYFNKDKNHIKELEDIMIKQAIERERFDYLFLNFRNWKYIISWFMLNGYQIYNGKSNNLLLISIFSTLIIGLYIKNNIKLRELKKYRILIENYKELKENQDLVEKIEFDPFYRLPIDIFNIDEYSLNEIKLIKKELKKKKKRN